MFLHKYCYGALQTRPTHTFDPSALICTRCGAIITMDAIPEKSGCGTPTMSAAQGTITYSKGGQSLVVVAELPLSVHPDIVEWNLNGQKPLFEWS